MSEGFWEKFTGAGSLFEQLFIWSAVSAVVQTAMGPFLLAYQEKVNAAHPDQALAPPDLADAVVRNYMSLADATIEAAKSGLDAERFATLVPLHGDAPGPQQLAAALLRNLIPAEGAGADSTSFAQGIREGRLADKWIPMIAGLAQQVISPADAAEAVIRNFLDPADGARQAAESGVSPELFTTLTHLAGDAPGPQQLAEALRRGLIPADGTGADSTSFTQGIAEGRLADKWAPVIEGLAKLWPTPVDALNATLKGQLTMDQGQQMYALLGGDLQFFDWLFASQGEGPTPLEAIDMARRGIIPWDGTGPEVTSYAQAFKESRFRDKWESVYEQAADPLPTEGELTEFLRYGIIDMPTTADQLAKRGITGDYATWVMSYAEAVSTYDFRGLTMTNVMNAFAANIISESAARQILASMHMSPTAIDLQISYASLQKSVAATTAAISHIGSLYTGHKITSQTAAASLANLGLDGATAADIMQTWDLEASVTVVTLTEAQIADAWYYGIMDQPTAIQELTNIGYTPYDAWVVLSIKAKQVLPDQPEPGPPPAIPGVTPGTT